MILKKLGTEYKLYGEDASCIATTQESPHKRLSKKNCDEMFGVIDVDDLAYKHRRVYQDSFEGMNECIMKDAMHQQVGFVAGFNKAMELNKDKLFTVEDVRKAMSIGLSIGYGRQFEIENKSVEIDSYIQSLQQPEEIEVDIKMEPCYYDQSLGAFSTSYTEDKPVEQPKLDKDGCLILTKKK